MAILPPFLRPAVRGTKVTNAYINAAFHHDRLGASVHALWWPPSAGQPPVALIFIPGNPGLVDFYTPFLTTIHEKTNKRIAILAHAHVGHTPGYNAPRKPALLGLTTQIESALEAVDAVKNTFGESTKIVVAGHSIGAWITLQILKARPDTVFSVFLLFPTITDIANTFNGRALSPIFRPPLPFIISCLSVLTWILPLRLLWIMFSDWPRAQVLVLRSLTHSSSAIYACLSLARDEMQFVRELDVPLLQEYRHRMHLFFADQDGWIGAEQRGNILRAFEADPGTVKVVHGQSDIPHAFCINHGEQVAEQCAEWLRDLV